VVRGPLLRSLLEDRFKLKARLVTKEMPAMIITLARDDGRLGLRLRRSDVDCEAAIAAARGRAAAGPPVPREPVCALGGQSGGPICGRGVTMAQFTLGFSCVYQRPVVDMTGLEGRFDFDLSFTPDTVGGPGIAFGSICGPATQTGDRPALSTAMQEQLGLNIRAGRAPAEVLVVDSAERPAEN
jgi:uncharacterized protein (TIGR03435 family)